MNTIKIFLTNLGKYNEGELIGKWFTLPIDDLSEALDKIGVYPNSEYEEFFISDYEAPFPIREYESIDKLNEIAELMEVMEDEDIKIAIAIHDHLYCTNDFYDALTEVKSGDNIICYDGFDSIEEIAMELYDQLYGIDEIDHLIHYIDWKAYAKERMGTLLRIDNNKYIEYIG